MWCFLGALQHYLRTLCLCSHLIRDMQYRVLWKSRYWLSKVLQRDLAPNPDLSRSSYHKDLLKGHRIKSTFQFCSFFSTTKSLSFSAEFLILSWICHPGLDLLFWIDFVILGWVCHTGLQSHFRLNWSCYFVLYFSLIMVWFRQSGLICHSGLIY